MSSETIEIIEWYENQAVEVLVEKIRGYSIKSICISGFGAELMYSHELDTYVKYGPGMVEFLLRVTERAIHRLYSFDYVIRIPIPNLDTFDQIKKHAVMAIANTLQIMEEDDSKLRKLKNELDESAYYNYVIDGEKESELIDQMITKINKKLFGKTYLLIVKPFRLSVEWLFEGWLPRPSKWNNVCWLISCFFDFHPYDDKQRQKFPIILQLSELTKYWPFKPPFIFEQALFHIAKSAPLTFRTEVTEAIDTLWSCLLYVELLTPKITYYPQDGIRNEELVRFLIAEGLITRGIKLRHGRSTEKFEDNLDTLMAFEEAEDEGERTIVEHTELLSIAKMILELLFSHSLLQDSHALLFDQFLSSDTCLIPFSGMWGQLEQWLENCKRYGIQLNNSWGLEYDISHPTEWWVNKSWISFLNNFGKWMIYPQPNKTTTLVLRGATNMSQSNLDILISKMFHLRVLDLSYSSFESLPLSLSNLTNLRLLSLKACRQIRTLQTSSDSFSYSPVQALQLLEVLDLNGVPLTEIHEEVGHLKQNLYFLDLSSSTITSLPSNFFQDMSNLKELSFLSCTLLETLPPSLKDLYNLEIFSLSESRLISLPNKTFEEMPKLRAINLIKNQLLRSLPKLAGHVGLESLTLSGSPITRLSMHACRSLETVCLHDLEQLEELDLSATGIKELQIEVFELPRLRWLNLLGLPKLKRLPWHKMNRLPHVLNLDQCEYEFVGKHGFIVQSSVVESSKLSMNGVGAHIFLIDSRLFSSFTYKDCKPLVKNGGSLKSFYITISSCKGQEKSEKEKELAHVDQFQNKKPFCYKDISLVERIFKQQFEQSPLNRHVEITSAERYPAGLNGILHIAESLSMRDDIFVSSLTDLNPEFPKLRECRLEQCHLMELIFRGTNKTKVGEMLQTLWVSELLKMTKVMGGFFSSSEFGALKHIHIQHCPKLECIFGDKMRLESLETVIILHCGSLKEVLCGSPINFEDYFPRLHTIQLFQLPQLLHLFKMQQTPLRMPKWKALHFRGCWNLCRLPLLVGPRDLNVRVDGETRQCEKLKAGMGKGQLSCYDFKTPPPPTSFREGMKNSIFLK